MRGQGNRKLGETVRAALVAAPAESVKAPIRGIEPGELGELDVAAVAGSIAIAELIADEVRELRERVAALEHGLGQLVEVKREDRDRIASLEAWRERHDPNAADFARYGEKGFDAPAPADASGEVS